MTTVSDQFFDFIAGLTIDAIPPSVHAAAGQHMLDVLGCTIAGAGIEDGKSVLDWYLSLGSGTYPVFGTNSLIGVGQAVAANAVLSHLAEADPVHAETVSCIAATTIPTVFTLARSQKISGADAVVAIVAGYEVIARLGRYIGADRMFARGWWPTALLGGAGAVASAAHVLRLSPVQIRSAVSLSLLHASGLSAGGTDAPLSRNLLLGNMARLGVEMALSAQRGIAGPREVLVGERTFPTAFAADPADTQALTDGLGQRWAMLETNIKAHGCALQAQSALDALLSLRQDTQFSVADVESIDVELPQTLKRVVDRPSQIKKRMDAMASLLFLFAEVLHHGGIETASFDSERRDDPVLREFSQRVSVRHAPEMDAAFPKSWPSQVKIMLKDGRALAQHVDVPSGHPHRPLSQTALEDKFDRLNQGQLSASRVDELKSVLQNFAACPDVGPLTRLVSEGLAHEP